MNKVSKSLIVLFLAFLLGCCFEVYFTQAQNNGLVLGVIQECDIQYSGDNCIAELKVTNNTGEILGGEAFLHIDYQGLCSNDKLENFDGEGIEAQFSVIDNNWLNFSDWENGATSVSGFEITEGETWPKLNIETVPNLCPGEYAFSLQLRGTTEEGEEVVTPLTVIGGGGGFFIAGLTIANESAVSIKTDTVTITWQTNNFATSRVIYDTISHSTLGNPPNYGYAFSTPEQDKEPKVTFHSIKIDDLTSETTYFYRTVSQSSPEKVSREHSFTTLTLAEDEIKEGEEEVKKEEKPTEGIGIPEIIKEGIKKIIEEITPSVPSGEAKKPSALEEEAAPSGETVPSTETSQKGLASMLASIGMTWGEISKSAFLTIIVILCLMGLALIGIREWRLFRRKRKNL